MSLIALVLCIIFVFWLLRMEYKQNPSTSWALWVPSIWMMKIASFDLAYLLGRADADPGTGSPYERYFLILLFCLGLLILYKRRLDLYRSIKSNVWLMVLIVYMFTSIFWSDIPTVIPSFKRWIRELIAVIMVLVIFTEDNPRAAVESVLRKSVYVLIPLSLLLVLFFPELGTEAFGSMDSWVGITTHKNSLGRLCYITVFFLVWALIKRWPVRYAQFNRYHIYVDIIVLGMAVYLLKGPGIGKTISMTSVITLTVGFVTLFTLLWLKKLKRYPDGRMLTLITLSGIVLGTASVFVGGLVVGGDITSSLGREATLTGRTGIWAELVPLVMREPFIGHGIDGSTYAMKNSFGDLLSPHNGYLSVLLDYGFIGLFLFTIFLLSLCRKAYKTLFYDYNWGTFSISMLFMAIIYNVAEPSIEKFTSHQMATLVILSVSNVRVKHDEEITGIGLMNHE